MHRPGLDADPRGPGRRRRAILALRDDAAPLPDQLSSLAGQYRAVGDVAVDFTVTGEPRRLSEQASLVAYRTAQEGLTNAASTRPASPSRSPSASSPARSRSPSPTRYRRR